MNEQLKKAALKLLVVIIDAEKVKSLKEVYQKAQIHLHFQCRAEGTASSEMLDYLGLGGGDKVVDFCIAPASVAENLLRDVSKALRLKLSGRGIGFILPLSGVSHPIFRYLDQDTLEKLKAKIESEVEKMKYDVTHELILATINQGFSDELMEAAREAGATGGTVIRARRLGLQEVRKFWGVSLQDEKEVVAIITKKENKVEIMKAISHKCGMHTQAAGLVLALPVDSVIGLDTD